MKSSRSFLVIACAMFVWMACENQAGTYSTPKATLSTSIDSVSYALGHLYGSSLKTQGYEEFNNGNFMAGLQEGLDGKDGKFTEQEALNMINAMRTELRNRVTEKTKAEGAAFLADNLNKEGVKVTESGLQYKIINQGTGKSPKATDVVRVHYEGQLLDGTYFDTSREELAKAENIYNPQRQYGPTEFPLNRVISGWTEGVQLMSEGSVFEFYIPSELAYGDQQAGQLIKPGSTLIFKVELIEVK